jgi:hypothetical protein
MLTCESAYANTMKHYLIIFVGIRNYGFQVFGRQSELSCSEQEKGNTADKKSRQLNRSLFLSHNQPYLKQLFHL